MYLPDDIKIIARFRSTKEGGTNYYWKAREEGCVECVGMLEKVSGIDRIR